MRGYAVIDYRGKILPGIILDSNKNTVLPIFKYRKDAILDRSDEEEIVEVEITIKGGKK